MEQEMTVTHTSGPWVWNENGQMVAGNIKDEFGDDRPNIIIETDSGFYGPRGADRSLIAGAPDMLAVLRRVLSAGGNGSFEMPEVLKLDIGTIIDRVTNP